MIAAIEEAILDFLQTNLDQARVAVQRSFEGIPQPGVYVSTEEGKFRKTTMDVWEQHLTIYVDIIFKSLNTEQQRRAGIYGILEAVIQLLFLNDLGLVPKIHPLQPVAFRNVTTEEMLRDGLIAYSFTLETHYWVSLTPGADAQALLAVAMSYYLQTSEESLGTAPDTPDAMDIFELP